ncbi:MAG: hypothetical protein HDKAJFGB_02455 [Anaerolineae bacterium]|nr:hypothetical protein [Anaerolineae bacterium]
MNHFAIGRQNIARFDEIKIALPQIIRRRELKIFAVTRFAQLFRLRIAPRRAQRIGLRFAASFGERFGKIGKEDGEPQPHRNRANERGIGFARAE